MIDGLDPEAIAAEMRDQGYQAKVIKLSDGKAAIDSASSGVKFRVVFYGCTPPEPACTIDLLATWLTSKNPMTLAKLNEWNSTYRFGKAYNDDDQDLNLRMYVVLSHGVARRNFRVTFERWIHILADFDKFRSST